MYGSILHYGEHYLACVIARSTVTPRRHCEADTVSRSNLVAALEQRDGIASLRSQ